MGSVEDRGKKRKSDSFPPDSLPKRTRTSDVFLSNPPVIQHNDHRDGGEIKVEFDALTRLNIDATYPQSKESGVHRVKLTLGPAGMPVDHLTINETVIETTQELAQQGKRLVGVPQLLLV